jgi:hypothetical protein
MARKILVSACFVAMMSMFTGCDDGAKAPTVVKQDPQATQEQQDKMKDFMKTKGAPKK